MRGVGGGGVLPGAPLDSCIRRYDGGDVGVGERCRWRRALRQAQGERICEARMLLVALGGSRCCGTGGSQGNHEGCPYGEVMGGCARGLVVGVPRPDMSPSGFLLRRYRRVGGVGVGGGCWWRRGPFDRLRANGFAGMTRVGCAGRRVLLVAEWEVPAAAGRAVREPPLRCVWGVGDATGVGGGGPPGAPLDSCLRRNDA